jgi:hypothetical protein
MIDRDTIDSNSACVSQSVSFYRTSPLPVQGIRALCSRAFGTNKNKNKSTYVKRAP